MRRRTNKRLIAVLLVVAVFVISFSTVQAAKSVRELENEKKNAQNELSELDSELVSLIADINQTEAEINEKEEEIKEAQEELDKAQAAMDKQYNAMKIRMKYMYEKGDESILTILFESGSLADFVNRVEYSNAVYQYDRNVLDAYKSLIEEITEMKASLEQEKLELKAKRNSLDAKKKSLNSMIVAKKRQVANFDKQLVAARAAADRQAKANAKKVAAQKAQDNISGVGGDKNPAKVTGVSGSAVVGFANQFIGNPYVWGGNSLTSGCDCSGFVNQVYAHFGISVPRSSVSLRTAGQEVSYNNMQAGDIVCYSGHVGIYTGSGTIVEAQSSRMGITNNRAVNCKKIITIRRVL